MQDIVHALLRTAWFGILARSVLTFVFWSAGLFGVLDFEGKTAEMAAAGLSPPALFAVAVTFVQLGGSALIIANRLAWLGAGALGVFLALAIPIAHPFWTMEEPQRSFTFYIVMEHVSLIGGLMVVAVLGARKTGSREMVA
ncbi:DoxX family protein [Aureimonas altamirensis]|uniref:DoxX family protein n=1 Tax=Aureimonas altamirensis TaxID=370622 RepID=UPI001E299B7F|nr:DoxX family protein [Aureimonas altamirensis]UHD45966.1 DoxX family protein [Aureimonas altamirensis]